jgi:hypothetical protein
MDLDIHPPLTGRIAINPWADFNISGQFICESFGLIAPGMPRTAARIGLHYTHVTIDGEPAQTTQLFTTMIATAFFEKDLNRILDSGLAAVDSKSEIHRIVTGVRRICREHPEDWRAARKLIHDRYSKHGGAMRDRNGYELNTAATIAALVYGRGDFVDTLRVAFNLGWNADNNAATSATIIGVIKGRKWMDEQGWHIVDRYRNITRDAMPDDETITRFGDRLVAVADRVILENGGSKSSGGPETYTIRRQKPAVVEPLPRPLHRLEELRWQLKPEIEAALAGDKTSQARAAYLGICVGLEGRMARDHGEKWTEALEALLEHTDLIKAIRDAPGPRGEQLRARFIHSGILPPT